ncbi:MAG: glycosyltransferase [Fusobacteriaceae bacterium]
MELSIIVPIYMVEDYLEECLDSLYKIEGIEKEIILVNDGSPDNSYLIIEKFKKKYPRETVVIEKENGGLSSARNLGIKVAKGEYISFIDSDDFIDPIVFKNFFQEGKKESKLDILIGNMSYYIDGKKGLPLFRASKIKSGEIFTGIEFLAETLNKPKCFREEVVDDIYRKDFLIKNNLYFQDGLLHEDTLFTTLAYIKAEKIKYFDYDFYFYRQRVGGIMSNVTEHSLNSLEKISFMLKEEYFKLESNIGKIALSKLILSFYKVIVYRRYEKNKNDMTTYKKFRELYKELLGWKNKVHNEDILFLSLKASLILRKLINKEITNKQKIPKL